MEANNSKLINIKINNTIEALKKNRMNAFYVPDSEAAVALVKSMLKEGETVANGGSVTLNQTGIMALLRSGKYNFIDRNEPGISKEEKTKRSREGLMADSFFMSSNAITESGQLYNVDGHGNRVAALIHGPNRVFVIAGYNKIVPTVRDAVDRVKNIACPANCIRLGVDSPCAKVGHCVVKSEDPNNLMCLPSSATGIHICSTSVVSSFQVVADRINVIIVGEELGF